MDDTDKLRLIEEHEAEYFDYPRLFKFTDNGFIQYSVFDSSEGKTAYIVGMFVSKEHRGGTTITRLIKIGTSLITEYNLDVICCMVDKSNPYLGTLQSIYELIGLRLYVQDEDSLHYRWDKK